MLRAFTLSTQMEGIHMVLERVHNGTYPPPPTPHQLLRELILCILQHNIFDSQMYPQRCGVPMETKCAPTFTNLFMVAAISNTLSLSNTHVHCHMYITSKSM